jgi:hypothetical protein
VEAEESTRVGIDAQNHVYSPADASPYGIAGGSLVATHWPLPVLLAEGSFEVFQKLLFIAREAVALSLVVVALGFVQTRLDIL